MQLPSFPTDWRDRWQGRLPAWVEVALVVALAIQAARLAWLALVPPAPFGAAAPVASAAAPATAVAVDPFYRRDTASASADVSGLRLFGLRAAGTGGGAAILADSDGVQAAYAVGDTVRPGAVLVAVASDHAVIESGGARRRLAFAADAAATAAAASILPAAAALPSAAPARTQPPSGIDPERLLSEAGLRPRMEGDRVTGYSVTPRGDGALLRQAGLQAGDVLLSVNGQPLTPERYAELADELARQPQITLTYQRGGETRSTTVQATTP